MKYLIYTCVLVGVFHSTLTANSWNAFDLHRVLENPCPFNYTGPVPNPEDCHTFYLCNAGDPTLMICPDNLCFNPGNEQCDHCDAVPGCGSGTGIPPTRPPTSATTRPTTTTTPTTTTPSPTTTTPTPTTTITTSRTTTPTSTTTTTERPTVPELICPDLPYMKMPYPGSCNKYYHCVSGAVEGISTCPDGLWFHFQQQTCTTPWDDTCS